VSPCLKRRRRRKGQRKKKEKGEEWFKAWEKMTGGEVISRLPVRNQPSQFFIGHMWYRRWYSII
jgi:hypothetical protein